MLLKVFFSGFLNLKLVAIISLKVHNGKLTLVIQISLLQNLDEILSGLILPGSKLTSDFLNYSSATLTSGGVFNILPSTAGNAQLK